MSSRGHSWTGFRNEEGIEDGDRMQDVWSHRMMRVEEMSGDLVFLGFLWSPA